MQIGPGWMLGVTPAGIAAVGPHAEIQVRIDAMPAKRAAILEALATGVSADRLADISDTTSDEAAELLQKLRHDGAIAQRRATEAPDGLPLAEALSRFRGGSVPAGVIFTAEEALVIPAATPVTGRTRALRAFVAGLRPDGRLHAYVLLLAGHGLVRGDQPDATVLAERVAALALGPGEIAAIALTGKGIWRIPAEDIDRIGAHDAHRLGPIVEIGRARLLDPGNQGSAVLCVAETALANLDLATPAIARRVQGVGPPEVARLIACAEGAERFAAGDISRATFVRAAPGELAGALNPQEIYALSPRQEPRGPSAAPGLWCAAQTAGGDHRWVPAEAVYTTLIDRDRPRPLARATSSGVAAHTDPGLARERALCELIERDAFMWTWLQRISRERIVGGHLPTAALDARRRLGQAGWAVHWVNLSLETFPVVLCCAVHPRLGLTLGAACDADPAAALMRATNETLVTSLGFPTPPGRIAPRDVRGPADHVHLHRDPVLTSEHEFLYASEIEIELEQIAKADGSPLAQLESQGIEPAFVDLSGPATRPFTVVRAIAPRLIPLSFGYDREPLGLTALARPRVSRTGQQFGRFVDFAACPPIVPHPFS